MAKKEIPLSQARRILWIFGCGMSALSTLVLVAVWRHDYSPWNDIPSLLFYLALPTVSLNFFYEYMRRILSGQLRITAMNAVELLLGFSRLGLVCIFVIWLAMDINGAVLSILLSDTLTFLLLVLLIRRNVTDAGEDTSVQCGTGEMVSRFWKYGRWNYLLMFSTFLCEQLPMILLKKASLTNIPVGHFSRARGIGQYPRIVVKPISQMLFPYTAASDDKTAVRRTNILCRNSLLVMILMMGFMAAIIKPMVLILYGREFLPSVNVFYTLIPGFLFWPMGQFIAIHIAASGRPRNVFLQSLITLLFAAPICYYLIPEHGMIGAGLSVSAINTVVISLRLLLYRRLTGVPLAQVLLPRRSDMVHWSAIRKLFQSKSENG